MRPLILATCLFGGAVHAQTPPIGRLFTTPEQRYQLDVARGLIAGPPPAPAAAPAAPPQPPVTLDGFVRRSGGRSTVWINQDTQDARPAQFSGPPGQSRVTVTLPNGARVKVKPGQTVDGSNGAVQDVHDAHDAQDAP